MVFIFGVKDQSGWRVNVVRVKMKLVKFRGCSFYFVYFKQIHLDLLKVIFYFPP